jgi:hypothetical protein
MAAGIGATLLTLSYLIDAPGISESGSERYEEGREKLEQYMQANRFRDTRTWRDRPAGTS